MTKEMYKPMELKTDDFEAPEYDAKEVFGRTLLTVILGVILGLFAYLVK